MKKFTRFITLTMLLTLSVVCSISIRAAVLDLPTGVEEGINYIDDNTVILVLLAPNKGAVEVTGTFNDWDLLEMNKTPDGERFWIRIDNLTPGQEYIYQYLVDGEIRIADPFAEKILDPWNDQYIPENVYPGLIEYTDAEKGLASVFQTAQEEYQWQVTDFQGPLKHHLVIYELLIRDFSKEHSFQAVIDSISYLKKLGINAIELLPVNEFDGNISWGYNPAFYFAVDKFYGSKNKLKELIDVAHQNGLAVILDMVYNHSMNSHPLVSLYWDQENLRPAADNPWYNTSAPHTCIGWGNDFNHESEYTQAFFDRVNKFWIEEFKIDGYRYDFTKGLTQTFTDDNNGCANNYDSRRVNVIKRMADKVWEVKDDAYVILEHWSAQEEEDELVSYGNGMLVWQRVDHQYKEVISGHKLDEEYFNSAQSDSRVIFMESHDENRIMVQNHTYGAESWDGGYSIKDTPTALDRVAQGAAFLYTVPGPKMVWMFGEQGFDYDINYCIEDGTVDEECRTGPKPIVWNEYNQDPNRVELYNTMSKLINLRVENEAFTHGYFTMDGIGAIRQIKIEHASMDVVIMGNFDIYTQTVTDPWFTKSGTWYNFMSGQEYEFNSGNQYVLAPGQWEIFTSVPIDQNVVKAPTNLTTSVSGTTSSTAVLNWVDNADNEITYQIERSASPTSGFALIQSVGANTTSYHDNALADGKYYYRVKAIGSEGAESAYSNVASAQIGEPQGITLHFKNTSNWSDVNIYVFNWDTKSAVSGWNWPGVAMTQEENSSWYSYTIMEEVRPGIVFNNGAGDKTSDLTRTTDGWYDFSTQQWYDECPGDCPTPPVPVASVAPAGGTYTEAVLVTLSASENGVITYTTDGTDPKFGAIYSDPLQFVTNTRLRAIAQNDNGYSNEIDETYTIVHPVPVLSVDPRGGEFVGVIDVHLEATNNGVIYYTLDGSDPKTGTVTTSGDLQFSGDTPLRAIALNANGWSNEIDEYYDKVESTCDTIYFYNSSNWSNVYLYLFNADGSGLAGWNWPGIQMTQIETSNWYYYVNCESVNVGIVFNDGAGQQLDDEYSNRGWFYNGSWYTSCPGNCPGETPVGLTLHLKKPTWWGSATIYFWATTGAFVSTEWPGEQMTDPDGDGWYSYTLPGVECANIIFSDKGVNQTGDLTGICQESWYDNGWVSDPGLKAATSIAQLDASTIAKIYPNPFNDQLTVILSELNTDVDVNVLDLNGQVVYTDYQSAIEGKIMVRPEIANGIYIMRLTTINKNYSFKIIKE
jgi:1,4-alpha-glucan branching enzyme